jgi:hypothetical protein
MRDARRIVERFFERHPERRGTHLERRAHAMLDAKAARVYASRGRWRDAAGPMVRSALCDPRALLRESSLGVPAARARAGRRLRLSAPMA